MAINLKEQKRKKTVDLNAIELFFLKDIKFGLDGIKIEDPNTNGYGSVLEKTEAEFGTSFEFFEMNEYFFVISNMKASKCFNIVHRKNLGSDEFTKEEIVFTEKEDLTQFDKHLTSPTKSDTKKSDTNKNLEKKNSENNKIDTNKTENNDNSKDEENKKSGKMKVNKEVVKHFEKLRTTKITRILLPECVSKVVLNGIQVFFMCPKNIYIYTPFSTSIIAEKAVDIAINYHLYVLCSNKINIYSDSLISTIDLNTSFDRIIPFGNIIFLLKNSTIYKLFNGDIVWSYYFMGLRTGRLECRWDEKSIFLSARGRLFKIDIIECTVTNLRHWFLNAKLSMNDRHLIINDSKNGILIFDKSDLYSFKVERLNWEVVAIAAHGDHISYASYETIITQKFTNDSYSSLDAKISINSSMNFLKIYNKKSINKSVYAENLAANNLNSNLADNLNSNLADNLNSNLNNNLNNLISNPDIKPANNPTSNLNNDLIDPMSCIVTGNTLKKETKLIKGYSYSELLSIYSRKDKNITVFDELKLLNGTNFCEIDFEKDLQKIIDQGGAEENSKDGEVLQSTNILEFFNKFEKNSNEEIFKDEEVYFKDEDLCDNYNNRTYFQQIESLIEQINPKPAQESLPEPELNGKLIKALIKKIRFTNPVTPQMFIKTNSTENRNIHEIIEYKKPFNTYRRTRFFTENFVDFLCKNKLPDQEAEVRIDYPVFDFVENTLRSLVASKRMPKTEQKKQPKKIDSQRRSGGF